MVHRIVSVLLFSDSASSFFESLTSSHSHFFRNCSLFVSLEASVRFLNVFLISLIVFLIVCFVRVSEKKKNRSFCEVNEY